MAVWTMSLAMAAAEAEGASLGDAAVVGAGLDVVAPVGDAVGDAAEEQAAIAIASAGTRKAMDRFMTVASLRALDWMWCRVWLTRLQYLALNPSCQPGTHNAQSSATSGGGGEGGGKGGEAYILDSVPDGVR